MNRKTIFRILGALASSLIAVSVFVPFTNTSGNLISLWQSYESLDALYLPIMIIVFGAIGIMFFSLNIKTEFAYMSSGATLFFVVMETIDILDKGMFNTLNVGYYFLVVGSILTGLMAFLTNLKPNKKEIDTVNQPIQTFTIDRIDRLYNDPTIINNEISPIQPMDNISVPIVQDQLIQKVEPIEPSISENQNIQAIEQQVNVQEIPNVSLPNINENPVVKEFMTQSNTNELDIFGQPINK